MKTKVKMSHCNLKLLFIISLLILMNESNLYAQLPDSVYSRDEKNISIGIAGSYYRSANMGIVIGLSGKIQYQFNQVSSISIIVRKGFGIGGYGAVEHKEEWDDDINSLNEISILYIYNLPNISNGLYVSSGISYLLGKKEDNTEYSFFSFPIVIGHEFKFTNSLFFCPEISSNINKKTILLGFNIGLLYEF